jgi:hypothetical protein
MYKLHGFSQSGNAYKVAVLLQALRQRLERAAEGVAGMEATVRDVAGRAHRAEVVRA